MPQKAPRIPNSVWERHKPEIISLYLEPQSTLNLMMEVMKERYGFQARVNQYRAKLKAWGVGKNIPSSHWLIIDKKIKNRRLEGKETDVKIYGQLQSSEKIKKEVMRNVTYTQGLLAPPDAPTPQGVEFSTPAAQSVMDTCQNAVVVGNLPCFQLQKELSNLARDISSMKTDDPSMDIFSCTMQIPSMASFPPGSASMRIHRALCSWERVTVRSLMSNQLACSSLSPEAQDLLVELSTLAFLAINNLLSDQEFHDKLGPLLAWEGHHALTYITESSTPWMRILTKKIIIGAIHSNNTSLTKRIVEIGVPKVMRYEVLLAAIYRGNHSMVASLCADGGGPRQLGRMRGYEQKILHNLWGQGSDTQMLRSLLESRADAETLIMSKQRGYPLVDAAARGNVEAVVLLLSHGASVNIFLPQLWGTALQAATVNGHHRVVETLIENGADLDAPVGKTYPTFWNSFSTWDLDFTCDFDGFDDRVSRKTPIHIAAEKNDFLMVAILLRYGASADACHFREQGRDEEDIFLYPMEQPTYGELFFTAMQYAAKNRNLDMVKLLHSSGALPDAGVNLNDGDTLLQIATRHGDLEIVKFLISQGADVNAVPRSGARAAIQAAAQSGDMSVLEALQSAGAVLHAPVENFRGMTATEAAAFAGHEKIITPVYTLGANINDPLAPVGGLTAIQASEASGRPHLAQPIIDLGLSTADVGGLSPLQAAMKHEDLSLLDMLIQQGAEINAPPADGCGTPLQEAVRRNWLEGARLLLKHRADANARLGSVARSSDRYELTAETALGLAIECQSCEMTKLLLENGAKVACDPSVQYGYRDEDLRHNAPRTPGALFFALFHRNSYDTIQLLVEHDPDIGKTLSHKSALALAIGRGYTDSQAWHEFCVSKLSSTENINLLVRLLELGADINSLHPEEKATCLQMSISHSEEVTKFLLERGAAFNVRASRRIGTPLQEAIKHGRDDIINMLLDFGADVNAPPAYYSGATALQYAAMQGMLPVAIKLLELGADVAATGAPYDGRTAIDGAAERGRLDILQLLLDKYPEDKFLYLACMRAGSIATSRGHTEIADWLERRAHECWNEDCESLRSLSSLFSWDNCT
ncbi:ankyrin repeat-containing domain protein [Aspergillus pseudoustus]|uniref:Ankyrin repeat-containing domain protein n=1 Tax=Aspergillus pseudoustus TaxID=1810923 RepID=A0ABR4K5X3_9EURO